VPVLSHSYSREGYKMTQIDIIQGETLGGSFFMPQNRCVTSGAAKSPYIARRS